MPLDWKTLWRVNPDDLPRQEELADDLLVSLSKMKAQEAELALEEVEKAGEEQAKFGKYLVKKKFKINNMAQQSAGGRDTRFLRDEIRELEKQLEQKDRELEDMEKEMEKEKKINEQLALRNEEAENENSKLRRENEQLRQDIIDYQKQIDSQKETLMSRRGEDSDYRLQLSKKNFELVQYLDEIQNLTEANEKIEIQNEEMRKNLEESVQEMEKMTDKYNRMKIIVQQTDDLMDQLKKERLQVQELTELLKAKDEEDDPIMAAVNAKVEEWKRILASKDDEIIEYQQILCNLREKLRNAQLDSDKNVIALQQGIQERDGQIKMLTEQIEQYTKEMETNTLIFEDLRNELRHKRGSSVVSQLNHFVEMQSKLQNLEQKNKNAERTAELAEADAREKDKELVETLKRLKDYEAGLYGLEEAVAEIKTYKSQVKIRDREIEALTTEMNKLELKMNDFLDENEDLRERLGLDPKTMIDLTEFRKNKNLKQQQYQAENQILLKEIESLEEERLELKQKIRKMAQDKVKKSGTLGIVIPHFLKQDSNEHLSKELNEKERDLERNRIVTAKFQNKVKELVEEKEQLEEGLKEILQTIKELQTEPGIKGETPLIIPSLEKLVNALDSKNAAGVFDANLHLKAQVDQLIGRNKELREELKNARKEATDCSQHLAKVNLKVENLEKEICLLRKAKGSNVVFRGIDLPDGMTPSSANIINSQNEYLIHILQELENKEQMLNKLEDSLEEYNRKFSVIRHQQGLLYKEYLSEKKIWQTESEKLREEKKKLEDQIDHDAIKVKEYNNLLNALQMNSDETKKFLSENSRKVSVLQVNEKSLIRKYTTLLEMERHLRKENNKQKNEFIAMEASVADRIGHLQRFKETTTFRIAALQKLLDNCVPLSELELANKQYNELTAKYRDMLQKDNMLVQRMSSLLLLECENKSLKEQIDVISKELEITKEKFHTMEQAWEQATKLGNDSVLHETQKAITNSEIVSISKKITMLEMKELNERQRAEHSQKMYEHLQASLKQVEERNFELETKFSELTKINLAAQQLEQTLRDELAESVSKQVSDADRKRILELEKSEMELKVEVSKLKEIADIAKTQVEALNSHQQSREKEVESLRMQEAPFFLTLLNFFSTSISNLYFARLEGETEQASASLHSGLAATVQWGLALGPAGEIFKTMIQLQNDKLQVMQEVRTCQEELELKLKGLEELISTLKDAREPEGGVIDWHMKIEELRLQELKLNRELVKDKEEIKYLKNIISEYEHTISNLEEEIVQQNKVHEEQQMTWDQREVELERQLDMFDSHQNEILNAARKFEEATGSIPDSSLPLPNQLEIALRKIKENVRIIMETQATCKLLEEKLKEKESALWEAEQNVLSRDRIINELRLRLPATAERERLMAELSRKEEDPESHRVLKVAHQAIANMQARLNQKEEVVKKYQDLLEKAREEQREIIKKHEEDIFILHQKLDLQADSSLSKFKQTAMELMKKPSVPVAASKHFLRLAEMEQTVAEQDNSLSSLLTKMKKMSHEIDIQKQITLTKVKEFESTRTRLEENHAEVVKKLQAEIEDLKYSMSQTERELQYFKSELQVQKEANTRAPTATMKNLVERLKSQLALKEKQQKALSRALLELRAEMTAAAEERIILSASQKEANLNVQQIVDRHTRDLQIHIEDLSENLLKCKEALKTSKSREDSLNKQLDDLNREMQKKQKAYNKILREKEELEKENEELKKRIKRLTFGLQSKPTVDNKQSVIDELQKKIKNLESQLEKFSDETEAKEKEELIRWEEGKKWQAKTQGMRNRLKEKEKEVDTLTKQLNTVKELLAKSDKDKITLQKKLKSSRVTADRVMGVHASDLEKELEELRKTNIELENEIGHMRMHQALPRDSVIEDLHLQNRYLQDKLHTLEEQLSLKDAFSKHSPTEFGGKSNREQLLQKENLKVSSENIELRFQLEQANKDLPRLKSQVSDMKEMCELLKKEKAEIERKLGQVRGSGRSGKTIPELEKTIGLMKKVVDKVQKENEYLKQASGIMTSEKMSSLELENKNLKSELEKLKLHLGHQLSLQYEFNAKDPESVMVEIDSLHKELKKKVETSEMLQMEKNDLEITVEKLTAELEEMRKRMHLIESGNLQLERAERQSLKSAENKKLKKELKNLDPSFFEEIEDLKYNYKEEVKKNIILEEKLKQLCEQFHIELESAANVFEHLEAEK
uniref:Centrosomal protein of 290kDa coiled-coil region domain-containing protein n=1 Tax=Sarcophilus harrisii TaxID=9305 RepID=A0A7N4NY10_SARHA